jgi:nucleoside-diphosphate-sugar epimerase
MVTGASGFTGGHLARALRARGQRVRALVRGPAEALERDGIELCRGDLRDRDAVLRAAQGCAVIYHIAAIYREARHGDEVYRAVNVEGTRNVLDAAQRAGVERVVHCSTVGVHGDVTRIPASENAPFAPGDVYQASKLEGELVAQERFAAGLPGVVFRPLGIYGPGDLRFLKLFKTLYRRSFRMIGSGKVLYQMTFIDDLVQGILLCGEHPAALGQTYILGGPRHTTVEELVAQIAQVMGRRPPRGRIPLAPVWAAAGVCEWACKWIGVEPPLHRRRLDFFCKNRAFSSEKANRELGYVPKVELGEGIRRTFLWYREKGLL